MRRLWIAAPFLLAPLLLAAPANAGGNWLEVRPEDRAAATSTRSTFVPYVGQRVVASTGIYARNQHRRERLLRDGPFYVWLSRGNRYLDGSDLPADAIRLSPFAIRWRSAHTASVRTRFAVPVLPSGEYVIHVCNDPCTFSGFGEYVQGWITVMQTPDEAHFRALAEERRWDLRSRERKIRRIERGTTELEGELRVALADVREKTTAVRGLTTRLAAARSEREAGRPLMAGWEVGLLALAVVAAALLLRIRRRPRLVVPDTVPDELIDRMRVGV